MAQPIVERPLQEIDRDDDPRLEPAARGYLVGRDSGSPPALRFVGQI